MDIINSRVRYIVKGRNSVQMDMGNDMFRAGRIGDRAGQIDMISNRLRDKVNGF